MTARKLIVLDIDDTQIPDRNRGVPYDGEDRAVEALRAALNDLAAQGHIIAHVTNGIFEEYQKAENRLATPHYVSCAASTMLYYRSKDGTFALDAEHAAAISGSGFDAGAALAAGSRYEELEPLGPGHQSALKTSFAFKDGVDTARRREIFEALGAQYAGQPGTAVQYVEGDSKYYIDLLPSLCNKGEMVLYLAGRENIAPENIITFGNGTNDISMFRRQFMCAAVENAVPALKDHVQNLAQQSDEPNRHIVAEGIRAQGVLNGLRRFNLI